MYWFGSMILCSVNLRLIASILLIVIGLTAPSQAAEALKRIVIVESVRVPMLSTAADEFVKSLAASGLIHGDTVTIERYHPEGDMKNAIKIFETVLEKGKPDLVVTVATIAAVAARRALAGTDIPHVFMFVSDPVSVGMVSAVGEKSDQLVTGVSHEVSSRSKLELVQKIVSTRQSNEPLRIGLLYSSYIASITDKEALLSLSDQYDAFSFVPIPVQFRPGKEGFEATRQEIIDSLAKRAGSFDAIWITVGPMGADMTLVQRIVDAGHRIIFVSNLRAVGVGALFGVLPNTVINSETAAKMARKILSGVKANDMAVVRPTELVIGVNLTTADAFNVVVPFRVLQLAGQNVYR